MLIVFLRKWYKNKVIAIGVDSILNKNKAKHLTLLTVKLALTQEQEILKMFTLALLLFCCQFKQRKRLLQCDQY